MTCAGEGGAEDAFYGKRFILTQFTASIMQRSSGADAGARWAAIYLTIGKDADIAAVVGRDHEPRRR